jgi:hypothetical protein
MRKYFALLAIGAAVALGVTVPGVASAETHSNCATFDNNGNIISVTPNCTQTISVQGGQPQSMSVVNPCNGDSGTVTMGITHQIFHINVNGAGDLWITGTQNGPVSFTPIDPTAASGKGAWASWFGGSSNNRNSVMTDTINLDLHLTSGQELTLHAVDHVTITGTGTITSNFSKGGPPPVCH